MQPVPAMPLDPNPSDAQLARRIGASDEDALRIVMRRHNRVLYRTARSILKDDAEAEDALQEAYVRAYRNISGYRGDAKLSTWLVRIVVNESLGRLRKRKRAAAVISMEGEPEHEGNLPVGFGDSHSVRPDGEAMRAQTRRLLEKSIDTLPDALRRVFVLRAVEEMTVRETAIALDLPPATVRSRFFRARALLRGTLKGEIDFACDDAFAFAGARCDRIVASVLARLADRTDVRCPIAPISTGAPS